MDVYGSSRNRKQLRSYSLQDFLEEIIATENREICLVGSSWIPKIPLEPRPNLTVAQDGQK